MCRLIKVSSEYRICEGKVFLGHEKTLPSSMIFENKKLLARQSENYLHGNA